MKLDLYTQAEAFGGKYELSLTLSDSGALCVGSVINSKGKPFEIFIEDTGKFPKLKRLLDELSEEVTDKIGHIFDTASYCGDETRLWVQDAPSEEAIDAKAGYYIS